MSQTLPTQPDSYRATLACATYTALRVLREQLLTRALDGDRACARLLPAVVAELDARPEGQATRRRRDLAHLEGLAQVRARRRSGQWQLIERTKNGNQLTWQSPLRLTADQAWLAFRGQANRPAYRAADAHHQLILREA